MSQKYVGSQEGALVPAVPGRESYLAERIPTECGQRYVQTRSRLRVPHHFSTLHSVSVGAEPGVKGEETPRA